MSDAAYAQKSGQMSESSLLTNTLLVLCAIGGVAIAWWLTTRPPALDRSIIGFKGFVHYAKSKGLDISHFDGAGRLDPKKIGLRILPLYDPNVLNNDSGRKPIEVDNYREVQRSMPSYVFGRKIRSIQTLVVLPKWRSGAVNLERLHPSLLISTKSMRLPYQNSGSISALSIERGKAGFSTLPLVNKAESALRGLPKDQQISLYAAQTLRRTIVSDKRCNALLQSGDDIVLATCRWTKTGPSFFLLTDPDIMNNHGAGHGQNFETAFSLVKALAGDGQIVVDATNRIFLVNENEKADNRDRSFSDLARFFAYPFTFFWVVLGGLIFFTLWHAWRRHAPVDDGEDDNRIHASKKTAIEANVAILRAGGVSGFRDLQLVTQHVGQRMDYLAADLLGAHRLRGPKGESQLIAAVARKNEALSLRLSRARSALSQHREIPAAATKAKYQSTRRLFRQLDEFEHLIDEVRHEFGRAANTSD